MELLGGSIAIPLPGARGLGPDDLQLRIAGVRALDGLLETFGDARVYFEARRVGVDVDGADELALSGLSARPKDSRSSCRWN
jgi:hypothetical protein